MVCTIAKLKVEPGSEWHKRRRHLYPSWCKK